MKKNVQNNLINQNYKVSSIIVNKLNKNRKELRRQKRINFRLYKMNKQGKGQSGNNLKNQIIKGTIK